MSQRKEKYARNLGQRVDKLEEWAKFTREALGGCGGRLETIEGKLEYDRIVHASEESMRAREEAETRREARRQRREIERDLDRQRRGMVIAIMLAIVALIVAVHAAGTERETETVQPTAAVTTSVEAETVQPTAAVTAGVETDLLATAPKEIDPWAFVALYRAAEDPLEAERIAEDLEAKGYFSATVPLSWEYQDYMRAYCYLYGCPYPLALAVADWETRGQFNMDAMGLAGEVGIFQLNPGPDGAYHAELEAATGLDPTTPEGNIAGGCYLLGKYLARYEDITMALMAYNMGQAGARNAWDVGMTSNDYTDAVLEALERWECEVDTWAGE